MIRRGEVWRADLGEPRGSAPALRRPVVVVQAEAYNASRLRTVVVVAVTSNLRLGAMPGNVLLPADVTGLEADSVANVTQVATVDRSHLIERLGALDDWVVDQLDGGLRRVFDL